MGKFRVKLHNIMPHVWYRRLKLEIGMIRAAGTCSPAHRAVNYKRWSSQRKLGASKKLIKASPLLPPLKPPQSDAPLKSPQSPLHQDRETPQSPPPSHPPLSKTPPLQEREMPLPAPQCTPPPPLHQERDTHVTPPTSPSHAQSKSLSQEERESAHVAPSTTHMLLHQAPSLSSPHPLISDKVFHLNLQELEAKLKIVSTQERRTYYSSPILSVTVPTPVVIETGCSPDKCSLDLDAVSSPVRHSFELNDEKFAARKLFCEEVKPFNESSHGSTSFTGQSLTSSEDTGLERVSSSSIWERDLSALTSEGSELCSAIDEIQNTVAFLRRKTRRARRDALARLRKRPSKEAKCKALHVIDDYSGIDDAPSAQEDLQSMHEQCSECLFNAEMQEGDNFVGHRGPLLNNFSPCQYDGCDKLSSAQCSDSAFSDSELESCRSYHSSTIQPRCNSMHGNQRQPPKQGVCSDRATIRASTLYNDMSLDAPAHRRRPCDSELRHPSLSKSKSTCRSLHSSACDCYNNLLLSKKASFDAEACHPSFSDSRDTCRRRLDANLYDYKGGSSVLKSANTDLNAGYPPSPSSNGTGTWRALNDSSCKNQASGYPKSLGTWRTLNCENQSRLRISKSRGKRSTEVDYDGDESLHSYSSTLASLSKSYSRREADGNEMPSVASLSKSPGPMRAFNSSPFDNQSKLSATLVKSVTKRTVNGGYDGDESLHSLNSVSQWSKRYSSRRELVHGNECNSVASMSERENTVDGTNEALIASKSYSKRGMEGGKEYCNSVVRKDEKKDGKKGGDEALMKGGQCWYKGGLRVVKEKGMQDHIEKSKVYESFAMVKCSNNPSQDFKESMMEMILHKKLHESMDLVELLQCYLALNSPRYHDTIVRSFIDLWSHLFRPSR